MRRLIAITFLLNVVFLGTVWWIVQEGRQQYELRARTYSENISKATGQSVADELDKIDLIVQAACDEISDQLVNGKINASRLNARLEQLKNRLPELNDLRATDAKGNIRYGSGVDGVYPADIGQDEHFIFLREHPEAGTIITKPKYSQAGHKWIIIVARAYSNPEGAFEGVVEGVLDLEHMVSIFTRLDVGNHGFVTLRDSRFSLIARHPKLGDGKFIGENIASKELRAMIETGRANENFKAASPFDGMVRIISFNKVGDWPLNVSVGLSDEDYLSVWRTAARNGIVTASAISLFSVFVAWLLFRYRKDMASYIDMLKRNESMFRSLTEMSSDWIWEQDRDFRFTHIAGNSDSQNGAKGQFLLGKTRWDSAIDADDPKWDTYRARLEAHLPFQDFEYDCLDANGNKLTFIASGTPLFDQDGNFEGYRGITKDITERKVYENRIRHLAQHDSLTQLPNRLTFYDRVGQAIRTARRKDIKFALFYIDLDNFKTVNDRFGHGVGDWLLVEVASRMQSRLRESDTLSRVGGDEFALIVPEIENDADIHTVAQKLAAAMDAPFELVEVPAPITIGLSIGIALFPSDGDTSDKLVRAADDAMYRAKREGSSYRFFSGKGDPGHSA